MRSIFFIALALVAVSSAVSRELDIVFVKHLPRGASVGPASNDEVSFIAVEHKISARKSGKSASKSSTSKIAKSENSQATASKANSRAVSGAHARKNKNAAGHGKAKGKDGVAVSADSEHEDDWWPGRSNKNEALNEVDAQLEDGGEWWLKNVPWFLPPPPEWGPMAPEMYESYYNQPVHQPYVVPKTTATAPFPIRSFPYTNFLPSQINMNFRNGEQGPGPANAGGIQDASLMLAKKEVQQAPGGFQPLSLRECNPFYPQNCMPAGEKVPLPKEMPYAQQDLEGQDLLGVRLAEQAVIGHPLTMFGTLPSSTRIGTPIYLEVSSTLKAEKQNLRSSARLRGQEEEEQTQSATKDVQQEIEIEQESRIEEKSY